jgi:hypothetical protein
MAWHVACSALATCLARRGAAALTISVLLATEAHAQAPFGGAEVAPAAQDERGATPPSEDEPATVEAGERRWYGPQTIMADAASLSMLGIAVVSGSSAPSGVFAAAGAVSWALAARSSTLPTVTSVRGSPTSAFGSAV